MSRPAALALAFALAADLSAAPQAVAQGPLGGAAIRAAIAGNTVQGR
jgi:hypothetical protein